jgi:hypothetical protein
LKTAGRFPCGISGDLKKKFWSKNKKEKMLQKEMKLKLSLPREVQIFSRILLQNTCLEKLDLSFGEINDRGAYYISKALCKNTTLQHLNLRSNRIGNDGALCIAKMLSKNTSLTQLFLENNPISSLDIFVPLIYRNNKLAVFAISLTTDRLFPNMRETRNKRKKIILFFFFKTKIKK